MRPFLQKKLFILDVDHTLIAWNKLQTSWRFRNDLAEKSHYATQTSLLRGRTVKSSIATKHIPLSKHKQLSLEIPIWLQVLLEYEQPIAIFSDFPQQHVHTYFAKIGITQIVDGWDIGCLKPLPDGCFQLMSMSGTPPSNTYLIGDGWYTDARSITQAGGQFLDVNRLVKDPNILVRIITNTL